jgi:hypothetical protein
LMYQHRSFVSRARYTLTHPTTPKRTIRGLHVHENASM